MRTIDVRDGRRVYLISLELWSAFVGLRWAVAPARGFSQREWGRWWLRDDVGTVYEGHSGGGHSNGEIADYSRRWLGTPPSDATRLVVSLRDAAGEALIEEPVALP